MENRLLEVLPEALPDVVVMDSGTIEGPAVGSGNVPDLLFGFASGQIEDPFALGGPVMQNWRPSVVFPEPGAP